MTSSVLRERMRAGPPLLLDGPTGTELERLGGDTSGPLWTARLVVERPEMVRAVHASYAAAGADILTTVTFRAHRDAFERAGRSETDWKAALKDAVRLAREAARDAPREVRVAGSIGPLGDCYAPDEVPVQEVVVERHGAVARALADAGPDLLLVETMNTRREAEAACRAAAATDLPVLVSFIVTRGGRLLSGEPLQEALAAVAPSVAGVLVNCATLPAVADAIPHLRGSGLPWGAYANGSLQEVPGGFAPGAEVAPEAYRGAAESWLQAGARLVGSCCGTGPRHIEVLRSVIDGD